MDPWMIEPDRALILEASLPVSASRTIGRGRLQYREFGNGISSLRRLSLRPISSSW
jgi:hypothetical protein